MIVCVRGFDAFEGRKRFEGNVERITPIAAAYVLQCPRVGDVGYDGADEH